VQLLLGKVKGISMRVSFEFMDEEVDKMYKELLEAEDEKQVDELIAKIAKFINRCGWSEDEFTSRLMNPDLSN
jgi:hypothetical protein